ncbi:hypothetical protein MGU_10931 [Metarhizium guizhouense ARSEF 977]|uniref:Uncharacterized protein n=1 Tax=Metarhizium guizhouense (strain ARSEF 977) TaxID=1276136 RepID=A0A0B4GW52_METGA|nr:hypothetical protein MGU_10931 [Metarhizium guizhouense ARSEF 977]
MVVELLPIDARNASWCKSGRSPDPAHHPNIPYDHGANIQIEVTEALEFLPKESPLRAEEDVSDSEGSDGSDDDDDDDANSEANGNGGLGRRGDTEAGVGHRGNGPGADDNNDHDATVDGDGGGDGDGDDENDVDADGEEAERPMANTEATANRDGVEEDSLFLESGRSSAERGETAATQRDESDRELFSGGLELLRNELEKKYNLANIAQVSYAIAVDVHCVEGASTHGGNNSGLQQHQEALCLLADRARVVEAYGNAREFTFYPLPFHQRYGNVTSRRPPEFLNDTYTIMRDNMSFRNDGHDDVLSFPYWQGYSNIKKSIRNRPEDLLATKGIATAALTLSPAEASRSPAHIRARQEKLQLGQELSAFG